MESNHEKIQKHVKNFNLIYYVIWALGLASFIYFLSNISLTPLIIMFIIALIYATVGVIDSSKLQALVDEDKTINGLKDRHP